MKVEITVRQETVNGVVGEKQYSVKFVLGNQSAYFCPTKDQLQSLVTQLTSEAEKALKV